MDDVLLGGRLRVGKSRFGCRWGRVEGLTVLRETLVLAGAGIGAGRSAHSSWCRTILFDVVPTHSATFITFLVFVALTACVSYGRRATSVDPMTALRYV